MFLILLFPLSLFAGVIKMKGLQWYELTYSPEELRLVTSAETITIVSRPCTKEAIVEPFVNSLTRLVQGRELRPGQSELHMNLTVDEKNFFVPRRSQAAGFLKNVPHEFRRMLIEESLRCEKANLNRGQKAL